MRPARVFGIAATIVLLAVLIIAASPYKFFWKGLYVGQDRAAAHAIFYDVTRYQSPFGGEPFYCITDLDAWRASHTPEELARISEPVGCVLEADTWADSGTCVPIGRPCSESITVRLNNNRVESIEVYWGFMP